MKSLIVGMSFLLASCANLPHENKQCGDSPQSTLGMFFQGMAEFDLSLMYKSIMGNSIFGVFGNNDEARGREIVKQIAAHPEFADESGGFQFSIARMTSTEDPQELLVVAKRVVSVKDRDYEEIRSFRVRYGAGNCIATITSTDQNWKEAK